jgi:2,3-bisphosphoglycerate-independent phosphoglycerate mutase
VPFLLYSRWCRPDDITKFSESSCASTSLSHLPATSLMVLAMANAQKLNKYGA